jgi:hypothetical protein
MVSYASSLTYNSLLDRFAQDSEAYEQELIRYADYRDGRPSRVNQSQGKYFEKRDRETSERYKDRPKLPIPLCRLIVDVHAEALAKEVRISLDSNTEDQDDAPIVKTREEWAAVEAHTELDSYWGRLASTFGTYGSSVVRPLLHDDGTPDKVLEFDSFTPLEAKLLYETCSAGRSNKRFYGVAISTGYSLENATTYPWPVVTEMTKSQLKIAHRVEYITKDVWKVWLDGKVTPTSPWDDVWMPSADGANPFGFVPAVLFNGLETEESFLGISDIHQAVYDNQMVNDIWYVPMGVLETNNKEAIAAFRAGIGAAIAVNQGDDYRYANAGVDFRAAMEPMAVALELTLAGAKTPAISVGMGGLSNTSTKSASDPSGVAKAYEFKPTVRHAKQKQKPFARGIRQLVQNSLRIMKHPKPYGQGKPVDPDVNVTVDFPGEIVPSTKAEELERVKNEILVGMKSIYEAMIDYHKWSPQRAQREMDMLAAEQRRHLVDIGFKDIVDIVMARQSTDITITETEKKAAEKVLFNPVQVLDADRTANEEAEVA